MGTRNVNRGRRDAKSLSMNRFVRLDPDLASSYDDVEEDPPSVSSYQRERANVGGLISRVSGGVINPRGRGGRYLQQPTRGGRRDQMTAASAAGRTANNVVINQITIPRAANRFNLKKLIRSLAQQVEDFKPINIHTAPNGNVQFYIKSDDAADAIRALSRRVIDEESKERVTLLSAKTVAPWTKISGQEEELINKVVDSRHNADTGALDLSEFVSSEAFKQAGLNLTMTRHNVAVAIMDRIDEKYGNISALSLKGNRLKYLDYVAQIVHITKSIRILDLSHNQIDKPEELKKLAGMPVETLFLEANPIVDAFPVMSDYVSMVHEVFPRVSMLDGMPVQPKSTAPDLEEEAAARMPVFRPGFYVNDKIRSMIEMFVVQYFKFYDAEDVSERRKLMDAYYDKAIFTLVCDTIPDSPSTPRYPNEDSYRAYRRLSHNIMLAERWQNHRENIVFKGSMDIAVALAKLPQTNHYQDSFLVDVSLATESKLCFTVQGLFEDGPRSKPPNVPVLTLFVRTFVVIPAGEGKIAVVNDMLFISAVSPERIQRYQAQLKKAINNANVPQPASQPTMQQALGALNVTPGGQPSEEVKTQMVDQFCQDSGMKPEWSRKCLDDCDWNYEAAGRAFLENREAIPADAFLPGRHA